MRAPIFLIGMPGSGKTTLGRALARVTGLQFIDLDKYIEGRFSCSVSTIFARDGEERFRKIEHSMLHEVAEMSDVIIACGGGTPCFFDNIDYINSRGVSICLQASRPRLIERLERARSRRPSISALPEGQTGDYVDRLSHQREPFYSQAIHSLDCTELETRDSIALAVKRCMALLPDYFSSDHKD